MGIKDPSVTARKVWYLSWEREEISEGAGIWRRRDSFSDAGRDVGMRFTEHRELNCSVTKGDVAGFGWIAIAFDHR